MRRSKSSRRSRIYALEGMTDLVLQSTIVMRSISPEGLSKIPNVDVVNERWI
jgi:hypothetical protein